MNSKYVCLFDQGACYRVKSGKVGHQVNSDTHLQTMEIQMRQLLMISTVCLVNLFFIPIIEVWNKQDHCPNLAVCPNIPDFTLMFICHFYKVDNS